MYVSGPLSLGRLGVLGEVDGFESPTQVLVGLPEQGVTDDAGSAFPAIVLTVHCTKIRSFVGSVTTETKVVSNPFVKGNAAVAFSPEGSITLTPIGVTTAEAEKDRIDTNPPIATAIDTG